MSVVNDTRTAPARTKIVLHGRKVVGGCAEGEALVTRDTISGWGGINEREGTVIERRHELRGDQLQGQGAGVSGRQGLVRLVRLFPHDAAQRRCAPGR